MSENYFSFLTSYVSSTNFYYDKYESTDKTIEDVKLFLKAQNMVKENDLLIHIASIPMKDRGRANMIKLGIV